MIDIVIKDDSIAFVCRRTSRTYFKKESCTQEDIDNILNHVGAYQKKKYGFFGKKIWALPIEYIKNFETEL